MEKFTIVHAHPSLYPSVESLVSVSQPANPRLTPGMFYVEGAPEEGSRVMQYISDTRREVTNAVLFYTNTRPLNPKEPILWSIKMSPKPATSPLTVTAPHSDAADTDVDLDGPETDYMTAVEDLPMFQAAS